jgi:serine/threonine protein kinase
MGEVFVVEHRELGREFVAKVMHAFLLADPRLIDRFRIEAQSLGRLNHPHIVSVVGFGTTADRRPFIVFERLRGRPLSSELSPDRRIPVLEAITYVCQLLSALDAVHALGIVHRDIKPGNLFICDRPDGSRFLKVLDFGVARVLPGVSADAPLPLSLPTDRGVVVGTPRFVSPEGALGRPVDQRADVYAAALVLYAMLAGRGPFDHIKSDASLLSAHANEDPKPPSRFVDGPLPAAIDRAILRALEKNPRDRFQSANEFCQALVEAADGLAGPSIWTTTDALRAEAARAAAGAALPAPDWRHVPPASGTVSPTELIEPVETPTRSQTGAAALARGRAGTGIPFGARMLIFGVVVLVTAVGVALLVGALRGGG